MAGTLFFAAMLFYGWSVGSGLDRSGNVTMAANSPEGSRPLPTNGRFNGSRRKVCGQLKESGNWREHCNDAIELSLDRQKCSGLLR